MKTNSKIRRFGSLILAVLIATLTLSVLLHATQVITTPNAALISYSLAAGTNSSPITPAANQSLLVMGTQTAVGFRGAGQVVMLHAVGTFNFLEWSGLESCCSSAITSSFSATPGTHIVFLDFSHQVDIQVHTADTFVVHNGSTGTRTGNVTLIW